MPVYEYRCSKGHDYERTEGFSAPTRQKCDCGAIAQRKISRPAVIFKGSGFYSTDNRRSSASRDSSSSDTSSDGSAPTASTPSESKADSKVEAAVD